MGGLGKRQTPLETQTKTYPAIGKQARGPNTSTLYLVSSVNIHTIEILIFNEITKIYLLPVKEEVYNVAMKQPIGKLNQPGWLIF